MSTPFSTNNPGFGGLDELTAAEETIVESIAALGAPGTFLKVNGAGTGVVWGSAGVGAGDVTKVGTPLDNQIGIWTGDGTLEGVAALTYDGTSFNLATGKNFQIAGVTILADAAGTTTLSNIDAIDATTEATIEAAIDTLANLTSIQGRTVTLADAGADVIYGWDDSADAYENLTQAEVLAVIGDSTATAKGVVELATDAETVTGTDTARATTPANVVAKLAAPGTIGGTTPGVATFTTLNITSFGANWTNASRTVADLGVVTTVDLNGGTIDGTSIGASSASTGVFTTLVAGSTTSLLLGTAGSAVGNIGFRNATSGTITLAPVAGALGTVTLTLPAITDTIVTLTANQTLTTKTLTSPTLTTPVLGTPSSGTLTNCTGLPAAAILPGTLATGAYILAENASIGLDPAGSADGKYTGITVTAVAGYAQAFGELVYLAVADSRWEKTDADAAATAGPVMLGMVVVAGGSDGAACTILLQGIIRADAQFPALTVGAPVYVGETAGAIQVAIPTGADNVIRVVGYALTADEIYFNPSMDHQISVA